MKILLATYWDIPHVGGVWNYMQQLRNKLEYLGHDVDLLGFGEENTVVHIVNKERKIDREKFEPLLNRRLTPQTYPEMYENSLVEYTERQRYIFELAVAYFGLEEYDIIHTQDVISTTCIGRIKPDAIPLIATLHGCVAHEIRYQLKSIHKSPTDYIARLYFDELETMGAQTADTTIVANNWLKNILTTEFKVPDDQIKILHYGFDTTNFLNRMKEKSLVDHSADKKVIIFTGRLVELKGVHHLLDALQQLKKIRDDWVCWIVGIGEKEKELRVQAKVLELEEHVTFMGERDDIPHLLSLSDIFVLPSLLENQPLSVIEAQLAGLAVVVNNVGGLPEIVDHNVTGIVTNTEDKKELSTHLNDLLSNYKYRLKLGTNAKNWAMEYWDMDTAIQKLLIIYASAISEREKGETNGL